MPKTFFENTEELRGEIGANIFNAFGNVENEKVRKILMQRQKSSRHIKGITSYYIHNGLGGKFSHEQNIDLAGAVEIYSTSMVLVDNLVDKHNQRDGETTYLTEYGPEMMGLASVYATNIGLVRLSPYIPTFFQVAEVDGYSAIGKAISSAVSMDVDLPKDPAKILENIIRVNGITLGFPLGLVASTAESDKQTIFEIMRYGTDTGTAFGLYEEIRDFVGEHGREKASEMKSGRTPYFLAELDSRDDEFNAADYVGRKITDAEHQKLVELLRGRKTFKKTQRMIKNYLDYGRDVLQRNLRESEFEILDSLRLTIEDSLDKMI